MHMSPAHQVPEGGCPAHASDGGAHERLRQIAQITRKTVGSGSVTGHALEITEQIREVFAADACIIRLLEGDDLVLLASSGLPPESCHPRIPVGWGISEEIFRLRRPLFIPDVGRHPRTASVANRMPSSYQFRSYAGAPLWAQDHLIGILGVYWINRVETFSDVDLDCLHVLANGASVALANEHLYEEVVHSRDRLAEEMAARTRAEEALRESERQHRLLFEAAHDGIVFHELSPDPGRCRFLRVNEEACRLLGYTSEEMLTFTPGDVQSPDSLKAAPAEIAALIAQGRLVFEKTLIGKDGRQVPVEIHSAVVSRDGGTYALSIVRDITSRKQWEEALRVRSAVLEAAAVAAERLLEPGDWTETGQALLARLGEVMGAERATIRQVERAEDGSHRIRLAVGWRRPGSEPLVDPGYPAFELEHNGCGRWASLLARGDVINDAVTSLPECERPALLAYGLKSVFAVPIHVEGNWWGTLGFSDTRSGRTWSDLETGAVRMAAGIVAAAIERQRSSERNCEWAAKLAHVARLATLSQMAAVIAHELQQPLTAISNHAEACLLALRNRAPTAGELAADLEVIAAQAGRAGEIIRRTRRSIAPQPTEYVSCSISALAQEVLDALEHEMRLVGVAVRLEIGAVAVVRADAVQVQQVLLNLLRNAMDAMRQTPAQQREILLTAAQVDDGFVRVMVRDGGCGVGETELPQLFDQFFTTKRNGLGLGLPISRYLVEAMGGQMGGQRNTEGGMTFWFTLPTG